MSSPRKDIENNKNLANATSNLVPLYPQVLPSENAPEENNEEKNKKNEEKNKKIAAEKLIEDAERIKKDLLDLYQQIQDNSILATQHQLLQEGKLIFDTSKPIEAGFYCVTNEFIKIIDAYTKINKAYSSLKKDAIATHVMGENDIENIEKMKISDLRKSNFYPLYQKALDQDISKLEKQHQEIVKNNTQKINKIEADADERQSVYCGFHFLSGVASVITLGATLPIFLGGLLIHQIDSLITTIKAAVLNHQINKSKNETWKKIKEAEKNKIHEIDQNPYDKFKQRFFSVCKIKKELNLMNNKEDINQKNESANQDDVRLKTTGFTW